MRLSEEIKARKEMCRKCEEGCVPCDLLGGLIEKAEALELALERLYGHTKNDMTICGLNTAAKEVLQ